MMRSAIRAGARGVVLIALLVFASSCGHKPPPQQGCWEPTVSMSELVAHINANTRGIPTLYARQEIQADLYDKSRNKSFYVNSSGYVYLRKPRELLLQGKHDLAGKIFEIGSTDEIFWFTIYGKQELSALVQFDMDKSIDAFRPKKFDNETLIIHDFLIPLKDKEYELC